MWCSRSSRRGRKGGEASAAIATGVQQVDPAVFVAKQRTFLGISVASLGRRPPMSVVRLTGAAGMDKGQISRALAGFALHDAIVTGAPERNRRLLEQLGHGELETLPGQIGRLAEAAAEMPAADKELG